MLCGAYEFGSAAMSRDRFKISPVLLAAVVALVVAPAVQAGIILSGTDPIAASQSLFGSFLGTDDDSWSYSSANSATSSQPEPPRDEPTRPELWLVLELQLANPAFSNGMGMTSPCPVVSSTSAPIGGVAWYCDQSFELSPTCGWLRQEHSRLKKPLPPLWELLRPA